jgi:hypothetical protein
VKPELSSVNKLLARNGSDRILTEYKCGCTWVGRRDEKPDYCEKHGGDVLNNIAVVDKSWKTGWAH